MFNGCPINGGGGQCVGYGQSWGTSTSLCASVVAGQQYYIIVDNDYSCMTSYSLNISAPTGIPAGTTCGNPVTMASLPYSATGQTTACMGNDYSNTSAGSCGSLYESGEDKVYKYVATGPECISVRTRTAAQRSPNRRTLASFVPRMTQVVGRHRAR